MEDCGNFWFTVAANTIDEEEGREKQVLWVPLESSLCGCCVLQGNNLPWVIVLVMTFAFPGGRNIGLCKSFLAVRLSVCPTAIFSSIPLSLRWGCLCYGAPPSFIWINLRLCFYKLPAKDLKGWASVYFLKRGYGTQSSALLLFSFLLGTWAAPSLSDPESVQGPPSVSSC